MLTKHLRKRVSVITVDGRNLIGVLHAADQLLNIVLTSCIERLGDPFDDESYFNKKNNNNDKDKDKGNSPIEEVQLGIIMLRGADIVSVAAVDVHEEALSNVKDWSGRDMPPVSSPGRV